MTLKTITIAILFALFLNSCKEKAKEESSQTTTTEMNSETKKEIFGTYVGTSPGANSLMTETLTLNPDFTFTKVLMYVDKESKSFTDVGTYKIENEKVVLNIDHNKEGGYYKIFNEHLLQLDITGEEITGENAEIYKMKKQLSK